MNITCPLFEQGMDAIRRHNTGLFVFFLKGQYRFVKPVRNCCSRTSAKRILVSIQTSPPFTALAMLDLQINILDAIGIGILKNKVDSLSLLFVLVQMPPQQVFLECTDYVFFLKQRQELCRSIKTKEIDMYKKASWRDAKQSTPEANQPTRHG